MFSEVHPSLNVCLHRLTKTDSNPLYISMCLYSWSIPYWDCCYSQVGRLQVKLKLWKSFPEFFCKFRCFTFLMWLSDSPAAAESLSASLMWLFCQSLRHMAHWFTQCLWNLLHYQHSFIWSVKLFLFPKIITTLPADLTSKRAEFVLEGFDSLLLRLHNISFHWWNRNYLQGCHPIRLGIKLKATPD